MMMKSSRGIHRCLARPGPLVGAAAAVAAAGGRGATAGGTALGATLKIGRGPIARCGTTIRCVHGLGHVRRGITGHDSGRRVEYSLAIGLVATCVVAVLAHQSWRARTGHKSNHHDDDNDNSNRLLIRHAQARRSGAETNGAETMRAETRDGEKLHKLDRATVAKHNSKESCWVIVQDNVWDLTDYVAEADMHPGGSHAILKLAGTDATRAFMEIHASETLADTLGNGKIVGIVDACLGDVVHPPYASSPWPSVRAQDRGGRNGQGANDRHLRNEESTPVTAPSGTLPLSQIITLDDFEAAAKSGLSQKAWAYYASTADASVSFDLNRASWSDILFRPRVLVDVAEVDTTTEVMGQPSTMPVYISPAALARLAHEDGELALSRAAGRCGIVQCLSSNSSYPVERVVASCRPDQPFFFQLYVARDSVRAERVLQKLRADGAIKKHLKGVILTVDAPVGGKRVLDERLKALSSSLPSSASSSAAESTSTVMFSYVSPSLTWQTVRDVRSQLGVGVKFMVKGISTVDDAVLAYKYGADGVVLSNHGGRQLDTTQPPLVTLLEIRRYAPWVFDVMEVHVDGGVRRGSDVLKAVALGATAVGLGRPMLYALANGYGEDGAVRALQIVKTEMDIGMRLPGVRDLAELRKLGPTLLNTKKLDALVVDAAIISKPTRLAD